MNPANDTVPPGVVTTTLPVAPLATVAVMLVADKMVKEAAAVPPKLTAVAPVKFAPLIVTIAPVAALVGVNDAMVGIGMYVNPANDIVPPGVVTTTLPVVPLATTAVMLVADTTVNEEAGVPPKLTAVAPLKLVPVIVTVVPVAAFVGANDAMVGAGT